MAIKLIYHTQESALGGISPFDKSIMKIAQDKDILIACPYLSLDYVKWVIHHSKSWRILTDIEEWFVSSNIEARKQIRDFISENQDLIRHYPNLHAKVMVAEEGALIGSANFTKMGITERAEMSVLFEKGSQVEELIRWFNDLWQQSVAMDVNELSQYLYSALPEPVEKPKFLKGSKERKIQANWSLPNKKANLLPIKNKDAHQQLIERVKQFESEKWINEYFDLVKELIEFVGIEEEDRRLALTIHKTSPKIMVNFNARVVLYARILKEFGRCVGFIFRAEEFSNEKFISKINDNIGDSFKPYSGEKEEDVPFCVNFWKSPAQALNRAEKNKWLQASLDELQRRKGSLHRQNHESLIYRAVFDSDYRSLVLEQAFRQ